MAEMKHSNEAVMQLRERLMQNIELMNNDNAVFEINKIKFKSNNVLPIPLYSKAEKILMRAL